MMRRQEKKLVVVASLPGEGAKLIAGPLISESFLKSRALEPITYGTYLKQREQIWLPVPALKIAVGFNGKPQYNSTFSLHYSASETMAAGLINSVLQACSQKNCLLRQGEVVQMEVPGNGQLFERVSRGLNDAKIKRGLAQGLLRSIEQEFKERVLSFQGETPGLAEILGNVLGKHLNPPHSTKAKKMEVAERLGNEIRHHELELFFFEKAKGGALTPSFELVFGYARNCFDIYPDAIMQGLEGLADSSSQAKK